MITVSRSN